MMLIRASLSVETRLGELRQMGARHQCCPAWLPHICKHAGLAYTMGAAMAECAQKVLDAGPYVFGVACAPDASVQH